MATNASPFVVNIVELQNIANSITGSSQTSLLTQAQLDIANIQQLVHYDTKTISTDTITSFTQDATIQFTSPISVSETQTTNTIEYISSISSLRSENTGITVNTSSISFITAGVKALELNSTGMLQYTSSPTYFSTGMNIAGFLYVSEDAYATNWFQTSDRNLKTNIRPFTTSVENVLKLQPCHFDWKASGNYDIGFIAQEVKEIWPELTNETNGSISLAYSRFTPLLLECIRELNERVSSLESHLRKD